MPADELISDPGVLRDQPLCEFQGFGGVLRVGGSAVLAWRHDAIAAEHRRLKSVSSAADLGVQRFGQALVHLQKSRPGTWRDLADAWSRLEPGGRLLLCGGNELGITSAVKRLAQQLGQKPLVLANRRHARIVVFERDAGAGPEPPEPRSIPLPLPDRAPFALEAEAGVFGARKLDAGSALLLAHLEQRGAPKGHAPRRILDLACGVGPLGLAALLYWPEAEALLVDGDARAVRSATRNANALGVEARCTLAWWDAREPVPGAGFDLVLLNPPFHTGKDVDLEPARAMIAALGSVLAPGGGALVVANRTLPYERDLDGVGRHEVVANEAGFKLLCLRASARGTRQRPAGGRARSASAGDERARARR